MGSTLPSSAVTKLIIMRRADEIGSDSNAVVSFTKNKKSLSFPELAAQKYSPNVFMCMLEGAVYTSVAFGHTVNYKCVIYSQHIYIVLSLNLFHGGVFILLW